MSAQLIITSIHEHTKLQVDVKRPVYQGETKLNNLLQSKVQCIEIEVKLCMDEGTYNIYYVGVNYLTVRLGNTLNLILLLNGIRVTASSCGINQLLGQALGHSLQVPKASLPSTRGQ